MTWGVLVFPGSNCDRDCGHALSTMGMEVRYVWHRDADLSGLDGVVIPGGFSYGDYLRCGAVAKLSPVMAAVRDFAERGGPVLGICNGFQILVEAELLPGALQRNASLNFICRDVELEVMSSRTPFTSSLAVGQHLVLPIAHAEGNYTIDPRGLDALWAQDQVVLRYVDNPNGSVDGIAGVCNLAGNVVGMMPHPERACEALLGSEMGRAFFAAAVGAVG